jgi:hypothetical protein
MKEPALLTALKVKEDDLCMLLGVRVKSLCFLPFWKEAQYAHAGLLFSSLAATRAALRKRWGEPIVYEGAWHWLNPETKLRARLREQDDPALLELEPYLPMQDFLGPGPELAFERTAILGTTRAAIEAAYGVKCEVETCFLNFPPCEVDWAGLSVQIPLTDDVATKLSFDMPTRNDARKEETIKLLEKKWGRRTPVEGEPKQFNFENRRNVLLYELAGDLTVRIWR